MVVVFCGFVLILANYLSQKIVGPIFSIKKSLEAIAAGDFSSARITTRKGDEFQEVAHLINHAVDQLEKRM